MAEARFFQADALSELGEFAAAILLFDEVITKYPSSYLVDAAWGRKGDCQFTLGADDANRYYEAMQSYRAVLNSATAPRDLKRQADYKLGRCLWKLGKNDEAFEQYYTRVVTSYLDDRRKGTPLSDGDKVWFTRAAFDAAEIMETQGKWRNAIRVLQRVVDTGVPAAGDALKRIEKIRSDHWLF